MYLLFEISIKLPKLIQTKSSFLNIKRNKVGYLYAFFCILAWSFIPVISRLGQLTLDFYQLLFWSNIISLNCLGLIFYLSGVWKSNTSLKNNYLYNLFLGSLGCALYYLFLYYGYHEGNSIEVLIIQYSWPLQMILLGSLLMKEKLNLSKILAVFFGFMGIVIIITKGDFNQISFTGINVSLSVLLGAFCFALFSILSKKSKVEVFQFSFLIFFGGTITSTVALVFFSTFKFPSAKELLPIIINGIFINGVSYIFWLKALKSISITNSAILVFFTPILSLIWIIVFFKEQFFISYIFGGSVVLLSSLYCLKEKK